MSKKWHREWDIVILTAIFVSILTAAPFIAEMSGYKPLHGAGVPATYDGNPR